MISNNENNNDFHLQKYFNQFVTVDNKNIFDVKGKIELSFSINYIKEISVNLAS